MSEFFQHGRVEVMIDPDNADEIAVSIDGPYAFGIPIEIADSLRRALNDMAAVSS